MFTHFRDTFYCHQIARLFTFISTCSSEIFLSKFFYEILAIKGKFVWIRVFFPHFFIKNKPLLRATFTLPSFTLQLICIKRLINRRMLRHTYYEVQSQYGVARRFSKTFIFAKNFAKRDCLKVAPAFLSHLKSLFSFTLLISLPILHQD